MATVRRLSSRMDEYPAWRRWMRAIGAIREQYFARAGADPLALSEAATVGLMLSAAGKSGLIGLLEYPTQKKSRKTNDWCYGRCDLWLLAPRHADADGWAFEIKHRRITSRSPRGLLIRTYRAAWQDAGALYVREGSKRVACTVFYSEHEIAPETECAETLRRLSMQSDLSWRISHAGNLAPVYIFLRCRQRGNRGLRNT